MSSEVVPPEQVRRSRSAMKMVSRKCTLGWRSCAAVMFSQCRVAV